MKVLEHVIGTSSPRQTVFLGKLRDMTLVLVRAGRMDGFGGGPMGPPMMRDDGPDGMLGRGDHGPPMMHHSLPGSIPDI